MNQALSLTRDTESNVSARVKIGVRHSGTRPGRPGKEVACPEDARDGQAKNRNDYGDECAAHLSARDRGA